MLVRLLASDSAPPKVSVEDEDNLVRDDNCARNDRGVGGNSASELDDGFTSDVRVKTISQKGSEEGGENAPGQESEEEKSLRRTSFQGRRWALNANVRKVDGRAVWIHQRLRVSCNHNLTEKTGDFAAVEGTAVSAERELRRWRHDLVHNWSASCASRDEWGGDLFERAGSSDGGGMITNFPSFETSSALEHD